MTYRSRTVLSLAALALVLFGRPAFAVTIDFDDVVIPPGFGVVRPSNFYAAQGVTIQTVSTVTDGLPLGSIIAPALFQDAFAILNTPTSVSAPNLAVYDRVVNGFLTFASDEVLMSFSTPVWQVALNTDIGGETVGDVVRLLGLRSLGGGQYQIIAIAAGLDNETTPAGSRLSIACPTFCDAVIFEQTTEQEGFDNLDFRPVPEPTTLALLTFGLLGGSRALRRRK